MKSLEKELNIANEKALNLQKQYDELKSMTDTTKKRAPMLGSIGKFSSDGVRIEGIFYSISTK